MQPQWASHDNPQVNLIWGYLKALDLDIDQVRKDMSNPTIAAIVDQDKVDLRALQVTQTPTFFVNGKPLPNLVLTSLRRLWSKKSTSLIRSEDCNFRTADINGTRRRT